MLSQNNIVEIQKRGGSPFSCHMVDSVKIKLEEVDYKWEVMPCPFFPPFQSILDSCLREFIFSCATSQNMCHQLLAI